LAAGGLHVEEGERGGAGQRGARADRLDRIAEAGAGGQRPDGGTERELDGIAARVLLTLRPDQRSGSG
jgi:hypothetical protein